MKKPGKLKGALLHELSEARFKFMFRDNKSIMLLIEPNSGRIIDANKSALKFYNYTIDQLRGMAIDKINALSPEQVANARKKVEDNEQNQFIFPHRLSNGEIRQVEVHSTLIEVNKQKLLFSIIDDITERIRIELELIQKESALRKAEEIAKFGSWQLYLKEKLMISTDGARIIYGLKINENSLEKIQKMALSQYRPMLDKAISDLTTNGLRYDVEYKIQRESDGEIIDIHSIAEYDSTNRIVFGTIQDITERKRVEEALHESQEKFRLIIENTSHAILFTEPDGTINFANPAACKIFGWSIEEFQNLGRIGIVNLNDQRLNPALEERKKTGKFKGELTFIKNDNTIFPAEISSNIFVDSRGIIRTSIILNDISERKQTELKIRQQNLELQKLNNDKDRFISILAHDLKSPFNSLLGFTNLLIKNIHHYDIHKIENQVGIIDKSAKNLYSLVDDLLLWTMSQSGRLSFEPRSLKLIDILSDTNNLLGASANSKNISVNYHNIGEITVFADNEMLKTILRNLVSNAIKFTNPNGRIDIRAEQNHSTVTITVSDNGIGVEPDMVNKMFDIAQMHTTNGTSGERGTGLGLVLCKEFIEKHGGKIWVESELGKGCDFKFTLPLS